MASVESHWCRWVLGGARRRPAAGFTLIELLASMAILVLIVMMMARVYTETTNMWRLGSRRVFAAAEGRVVMDFLVRELTMAIADDVVTFRTVSPGSDGQNFIYGMETYGAEADEVFFTAMVRRGSDYFRRSANQYCYFIAPMTEIHVRPDGTVEERELEYRYRLARTRKTRSMFASANNRAQSAYREPLWWDYQIPDLQPYFNGPHAAETIAENVAAFEIWSYSENAGDYVANYQSRDEGDKLPVWADIYLEILGEEDAVRAAELWKASEANVALRPEARRFVDNNVRRYMARVFFANRERAKAFEDLPIN